MIPLSSEHFSRLLEFNFHDAPQILPFLGSMCFCSHVFIESGPLMVPKGSPYISQMVSVWVGQELLLGVLKNMCESISETF